MQPPAQIGVTGVTVLAVPAGCRRVDGDALADAERFAIAVERIGADAAGQYGTAGDDVIVADYCAMLVDDITGRAYNKSAHNRALQARIVRSRSSLGYFLGAGIPNPSSGGSQPPSSIPGDDHCAQPRRQRTRSG